LFGDGGERISGNNSSSLLNFFTAGAERMRIESNGHLLVGTTSAAVSSSTGSVTGAVINSTGLFEAARDGTIMELNRVNTDGIILRARKNGAVVGSIGTSSADGFYIHSTFGNDSGLVFGSERIVPCTSTGAFDDAAVDLGYSSGRFKDLYLSGTATMDGLTVGDNHTIGDDNFDNLLIQSSSGEGIRLISNHATNPLTMESDVGFVFKTLFGTNRFEVTSTGNIKQNSVNTSTNVGYSVNNGTYDAIALGTGGFGVNGGAATDGGIRAYNNLLFGTGASAAERMRIDSAGNLLVGTTDNVIWNNNAGNATDNGHNLRADGRAGFSYYNATTNTNATVNINRTGSDGDLIRLFKSGTVVGSIGTDASRFKIKSNSVALYLENESNKQLVWGNVSSVPYFYPQSDNDTNIGYPTQRFKDLYLSGTASIGSKAYIKSDANVGYFGGDAAQTNHISFYDALDLVRVYTAGTERMRIDSAGNLFVGCTSIPTGGSSTGFSISDNDGKQMVTHGVSGTNNTYVNVYKNANGIVGGIRVNGSATFFDTASDQRLKKNIADADDAGSKIDAIQVRKYDWKADGSHQDYGMIAQELLEVAPEAVSQGETAEEMMGVDYSKLVPMLIKEIQSLRNRVAQLETGE
jgi:hypothetical protein